jgi:cobaltochelatase CobS
MNSTINSSAHQFAQGIDASTGVSLTLSGISIQHHAYKVLNRMENSGIDSMPEIAGALAQLLTIMESDAPLSEKVTALRKLIISPLMFDDDASALARAIDVAGIPGLAKYSGNLTYRYILKNIGYNSLVALCATLSDKYTVQGILMSNAQNGGWTHFGNDYQFDPVEYQGSLTGSLDRAIKARTQPTSLKDVCAMFGKGPYPSGFDTKSTPAAPATTPTTTQGTQAMATTPTISVNAAVKPLIDGMLAQAGVNLTIDSIVAQIAEKDNLKLVIAAKQREHDDEVLTLRQRLANQSSMPANMALPSTSATIPAGKVNMVQAETLFPMLKGLNLLVPHFIWDHAHPDVPAENASYIFRKESLVKVLRCLTKRENIWLQGHTGSGKTTLIEQVASRLGWPVARVAFDSSVDRSEMVGRMQLDGDGKGGTISQWLSGILEKAWSSGYILLCDELDAGHPNALYTLQPMLEGKPLTLLEDGGRVIPQAPFSCIAATGNTTGNGDPSGLYPACRILSAATLDRFQTFVQVPYMTPDEETKLINTQVPGLAKTLVNKMVKFGVEMREAFVTGQTPISYSPRRSVAFAREINDMFDMGYKDENLAVTTAFKSKLYDAASDEYRQRITELANAAFGSIDPTKTMA